MISYVKSYDEQSILYSSVKAMIYRLRSLSKADMINTIDIEFFVALILVLIRAIRVFPEN